jgi:quinolinate synthase
MPEDHIKQRIDELRKERSAVILAHNYTRPDVQDIADFTGDSLGLSRRAASTDAEVIVFAGVRFMAETAAILCPDRVVLHPDPNAGCPLADMITPRELEELKRQHPDALVVAYVNTTAEIKALSDICCTSSNAKAVVESLPENREIIFIPDRNLGRWVSERTGRALILHEGFCPTHMRILKEMVEGAKRRHPEALVVVHPEVRKEVADMADHVASTGGMIRFCCASDAKEFIIGTEEGMVHALERACPQKEFHLASPVSDCPNMKLITLEKILWSLEDLQPRVVLPEHILKAAYEPIRKMTEITGG